MGVERMHPPKYWLMRAEEFHTKADNCQYPATRDSRRQAAKNFEELARQAQMILDLTTQWDERGLQDRRVAQEHADDQRGIMGSPRATDELRPPPQRPRRLGRSKRPDL